MVQFNFTVLGSELTPIRATLLPELNQAAAGWSRGLAGGGTITVDVHPGTLQNGLEGLAQANFVDSGTTDQFGERLFVPLSEFDANSNGTAAGHPALTPDIVMTLDVNKFVADKDPVSFLAYLLGHGLGFTGFYDPTSGMFDPTRDSSFDALVTKDVDGSLHFHGAHAGDVLMSQNNPYHIAATGDGVFDLMSDMISHAKPGPLDFQILADIGYQVDPLFFPSG